MKRVLDKGDHVKYVGPVALATRQAGDLGTVIGAGWFFPPRGAAVRRYTVKWDDGRISREFRKALEVQ